MESRGHVESSTPFVIVTPDGRYEDANPAALEILGVTLEELRASDPSRFATEPADPEGGAEFERQWRDAGQPDIGGETTIVRPDGRRRRIRFVITRQPDGRLVAVLEPLDTATPEPTVVYTAGDILAQWRAAERRLEALRRDSPDYAATQAQIDKLRRAYHTAFDARRG